MSTAVILGGGISGLTTAYYLSKCGGNVFRKIILLESGSELGGWIKTSHYQDGTIFEHGPRSLRGRGKSAHNSLQLAEELGLENEIISVSTREPAAQNRFLYCDGKVHKLPNSLMSAVRKQSPMSKPLASAVIREYFTKPKLGVTDETIHEFMTRRLGSEVAQYLVDPLCRGVYSGNSRELSVKACFPDFLKWEQQYGGLIRGAIKSPKVRKPVTSNLVKLSKADKWAMWSFEKGMQRFPEALAEKVASTVDVKLSTQCTLLELSPSKVRVHYGKNESIDAEHVFCGLSSKAMASLLSSSGHSTLQEKLTTIKFATVGVANLEYSDKPIVQGFGHLIPSCEPSNVLGVVYDSCSFPQHDCKTYPSQRYTVMMGGAWFSELFGDPDSVRSSDLEQVALDAMTQQMGISKDPTKVVVQINKNCIPQYQVGHTDLLKEMGSYIKDHNLPLSLIGASYNGVSVNDCILNAKLEVGKVLNMEIDR